MSDVSVRHKLCSSCKQAIEDINISTQTAGRYWHPDHFICKECKKDLNESIFFLDDDLHCENCQRNKYGIICEACKKPITVADYQIVVTGNLQKREWHLDCFKCSKCQKVIHQKTHHISTNGEVICNICFRKR